MNVTLYRYKKTAQVTLGVLLFPGESAIFTLERPWLENKSNVSCIPAGKYVAKFLSQSASGKYKNVFHITPVEGRSGILIHNGNLVTHTKGCILVGTSHGILLNQPAVLGSRTAMRKMQKFKSGFALEIL